jgi:hypothetical protein
MSHIWSGKGMLCEDIIAVPKATLLCHLWLHATLYLSCRLNIAVPKATLLWRLCLHATLYLSWLTQYHCSKSHEVVS